MICKKCGKECYAIDKNGEPVSNCCESSIDFTDYSKDQMQGCWHNYPTSGSVTGYPRGITLRDYFAAKAMQSYIITVADKNSDDYEVEREIGKDDGESAEYHISKWAYIIADAMLEAREK